MAQATSCPEGKLDLPLSHPGGWAQPVRASKWHPAGSVNWHRLGGAWDGSWCWLCLCAALVALAALAGAVAVLAVLLEQPCPVLFSAQV